MFLRFKVTVDDAVGAKSGHSVGTASAPNDPLMARVAGPLDIARKSPT